MRLPARLATASTIGLILLGAPAGPNLAAAAARTPCGSADALLAAGHYTRAYAGYAAVRPTSTACARQGMAAAGDLQAASQLISIGLVRQADAEIIRAVAADPTLTLPASLLPPNAAVTRRAIALAESLSAHGFRRQAAQILLSVIQADPGIRLEPPAREILAAQGESFWAWLGKFARSLPGLATVAVLLLLALSLYPRLRRRLHLQKFTIADGPAGVDPEDVRVRVEDELQRLSDEQASTPSGRRLRLDIAGPYDETVSIGPVVEKAPDWVQFIVALVGVLVQKIPWLSRLLSRARLVTGNLKAGVVVDVAIQTVDKVEVCSAPVKHEDFGFPPASPASARYAQLALPIAAWIIFGRYRKCTLGGTRDLQSFAKFAAGCAWQDLGDLGMAERYYQEAREKDKGNAAAVHNLAVLWQQDEIAGSGQIAGNVQTADYTMTGRAAEADRDWRALLRSLIRATRSKTRDPQWLRSRYALSRGLADLAQNPDEARHYAREFAIEVEEQLKRPRKHTQVEFLTRSRGAALALAASQLIPFTDDIDDVSVAGTVPENVSADDVMRLLRYGGDGAPEILAAFIEANCPEDAEVKYNLYRYQRNRIWACEDAAEAINRELRGGADSERRAALQARLGEVEGTAGRAAETMNRYHREIIRAADLPVLARIEAVAKVRRVRREDDDPETGLAPPSPPDAGFWRTATERRQEESGKIRPPDRIDNTFPDDYLPR